MANQPSSAMNTLFFLCNGDETYYGAHEPVYNSELPELIKETISEGEYFEGNWSCWNSTLVEVGDRAYLVKSSSESSSTEPRGIIAAGHIIAAPPDKRLSRLQRYSHLSEAYLHDDEGCFFVYMQLDSVVDFDYPLEQKFLKSKPEFQGVNFNFGRGGARFALGNPAAAKALASEWETHSLIQQRRGRGRRLTDVFLEQGDEAKKERDYETAIAYYHKALEVDPDSGKAINSLKTCQAALGRATKSKPGQVASIEDSKSKSLSKTILQNELANIRGELDKEDLLNLSDANEARKRVLVSIVRRQGQTKFRQALLEAYEYKCAISGFDAEAALEAAHIISYAETGNNSLTNGLLLRADLHTLFDLNLLAICPDTMQIFLHPDLRATEYRGMHRKQIRLPVEAASHPDSNLLQQRYEQCDWMF